jgi:DNA-binding beta-propeller fold protein YncE
MHSDSALYVSLEDDNKIFRFSFYGDPDFTFLVNDPPDVVLLPLGDKPHDIIFTPDESKYFVACAGTNMVRIFQSSNDSLIASVPVGRQPRELAVSHTFPYVFVTCELDTVNNNIAQNELGSVMVINYNTNAPVPTVIADDLIYFQPHGIAVDDANGKVYVGSRNISGGPPPHHTTDCGTPGWVTILDMTTLKVLSFDSPIIGTYYYKYEVLADPYSVMVR